ncbi:MAG: PAS domain-containing protein, partial [Chitinivibrionales bacterium]|nr:PAS domain-containing protein [Chitinivibrionales bacterium]
SISSLRLKLIEKITGTTSFCRSEGAKRLMTHVFQHCPHNSINHNMAGTNRMYNERQLLDNETRMHFALEAANCGIWEWNLSTNQNTWSKEVWKLFGLTQNSIEPSYATWLHTTHPQDRVKFEKTVGDAVSKGTELKVEWRRVDRNGMKRWIMALGKPQYDVNGLITRYIGIVIDITEQKELELRLTHRICSLAQANKELESFSHSMVQELRMPLATMKIFSNILLDDYHNKFGAKGQGILDRISTCADMMKTLIDAILIIFKISHHKIEPQVVDVSSIAKSIIYELKDLEPERKVDAVIAEKLKIYGDPRLMKLALTNLITNAWKYSSKTQHTRIELGRLRQDGRDILYIRDNGAGFDGKFSDKLFAPYHRLLSESQFPGTGAGLAIVDKIIRRHNGQIWGENMPGKGTTFYFTIPGNPSDTAEMKIEHEKSKFA